VPAARLLQQLDRNLIRQTVDDMTEVAPALITFGGVDQGKMKQQAD
jgi:hypothetical protein